MYFFTSWGWNPFVLEGNKPIWSPIRGPDGWLSLFPILSSLAIPSSRRHGDHAPASSENPKHEVVYKWKRSDVVSLLRKGLHNTLIVFKRNVSFKELLCLEDLRYQLIIHVWRVIRERKQSLLTERTLTTLNRKFPVLNKSTDYGFENVQAAKASTSHF